jgi:hypothetical protein
MASTHCSSCRCLWPQHTASPKVSVPRLNNKPRRWNALQDSLLDGALAPVAHDGLGLAVAAGAAAAAGWGLPAALHSVTMFLVRPKQLGQCILTCSGSKISDWGRSGSMVAAVAVLGTDLRCTAAAATCVRDICVTPMSTCSTCFVAHQTLRCLRRGCSGDTQTAAWPCCCVHCP